MKKGQERYMRSALREEIKHLRFLIENNWPFDHIARQKSRVRLLWSTRQALRYFNYD